MPIPTMPDLPARLHRIRPSPSSMASQRARALRGQGRDVLALTAGEPDFDTPQHIQEAARRAMASGQTRYTDVGGTPELKAAIAGKFRAENGLHFSPDEIIVGAGAKQIIFNTLMCTVRAGDEVIVPAPYWVSYPDIVWLAGGVPVHVDCPASLGFKLQPEALEQAITARTRWLILNSPNNPSGAAYLFAELQALAEVLKRHPQVWVMTDDVYEHILYGDMPFASIAQVAPELRERILTVNGVSKAYAMTGWRIGYGAAPAPLIAAMVKLQSHSTSGASSIGQAAAVATPPTRASSGSGATCSWRRSMRSMASTATCPMARFMFSPPAPTCSDCAPPRAGSSAAATIGSGTCSIPRIWPRCKAAPTASGRISGSPVPAVASTCARVAGASHGRARSLAPERRPGYLHRPHRHCLQHGNSHATSGFSSNPVRGRGRGRARRGNALRAGAGCGCVPRQTGAHSRGLFTGRLQ